MREPPDEQIVVRGAARIVAYAIDANGRMPAKEFLDATGKSKKCPTDLEKAGLLRRFGLMANKGRIPNTEHFHKVQDGIYGFKSYQTRVAAFREGRVWYLTHGFKKKRDKWPPNEIERAKRIRQEHLNRMKGL